VSCDKCGRSGRYQVQRLIRDRGRDGKLVDWLDQITADCPKKATISWNDRCGAITEATDKRSPAACMRSALPGFAECALRDCRYKAAPIAEGGDFARSCACLLRQFNRKIEDGGTRARISRRSPYRSGPSKTWIKIKIPKAPAATRAADGTF